MLLVRLSRRHTNLSLSTKPTVVSWHGWLERRSAGASFSPAGDTAGFLAFPASRHDSSAYMGDDRWMRFPIGHERRSHHSQVGRVPCRWWGDIWGGGVGELAQILVVSKRRGGLHDEINVLRPVRELIDLKPVNEQFAQRRLSRLDGNADLYAGKVGHRLPFVCISARNKS